jgi:hypothetical protein
LVFKLTSQEGQRLTAAMLAMRPDWTPNNPGSLLAVANEAAGLPGHDFGHALRALAHYATATGDDGRHQYRTPNIYVQDGKHWTATAPETWTKPKPPACPDHIGEEAPTCRCCHADVKVGLRPAEMIGKHYEPESENDE